MKRRDLGLIAYAEAWRLQKELVESRRRGETGDVLLLAEHPPVYTQGVSSRAEPPGPLPHPLHQVERGGEITYHGPGQLVGYPILSLDERGLAVGDYLRELERALIAACRRLGVEARALRGFTGVWAGDRKVASIGIAVKGGVAYHGFALNVSLDLAPFSRIFPCNLEPGQMGSLSRLLGRDVPMAEAREAAAGELLARLGAREPQAA